MLVGIKMAREGAWLVMYGSGAAMTMEEVVVAAMMDGPRCVRSMWQGEPEEEETSWFGDKRQEPEGQNLKHFPKKQ